MQEDYRVGSMPQLELSGRPVLFNNLVMVAGAPQVHRETIDWINACHGRGHRVYAQAITNDPGMIFTLEEDFNLFDSSPTPRSLTFNLKFGGLEVFGWNPQALDWERTSLDG